ncbi:uncharacterized protein BDV17DRAFT_290980 [Aspergillus undulatus]|uniref:uncharacterized protein n=1 Tax=Aspergillus undulatus TaxID=1810928 RepID=UPI003CCDC21B
MAPYLDERPFSSPQDYCFRKKPSHYLSSTSWTAKSFNDESAYTYVLTEAEIHEVNEALVYFNESGLSIDEANQFNFPLPTLGKALRALALEIHEGKGFFVLRGLNPDKYTIEDNTTDDGTMFGHVCNPDTLAVSQESRPLKYSNRASTFHNDLYCDIIALQSRSCAQDGGNHLLVSASKVYEELQRINQQMADRLFEPDWPLDLRRRFSSSETRPLFFRHGTHLISSVIPDALIGSPDIERQPSLVLLTPTQRETLSTLQSLCRKHAIALPMKKGDLLFVNNFALLHARDEFRDSPIQKRYLVRLWLKNDRLSWDLPEVMKSGNEAVFRDVVEKVWNYIPEDKFRFAVYERQSP